MEYPNISLQIGKEIRFFAQTEVVHLTADDNYSVITTADNKRVFTTQSLKSIEEKLTPEIFVRIHNSAIANISCISHFSHDEENIVIMKNGDKLPVSRRKKKDLLSRFIKL